MALPLYRQEKDDTCALACLRMILAHCGTEIAENTLAARAPKQPGGVDIEDLRNLAENFGFQATIEQRNLHALAELLAQGI